MGASAGSAGSIALWPHPAVVSSMLKVMKMSIGRDQGVLPTMLTDGDVARALMISKSTLRRIIARKEIKFTYSGKRRRYLPEHVVEYLKTEEGGWMPKSAKRAGEINGYWLSQRPGSAMWYRILALPTPGSAMWYRTWFDTETRQTRRVSLGTGDFESAGLALATWVAAKREAPRCRPAGSNPRRGIRSIPRVTWTKAPGCRLPAHQFAYDRSGRSTVSERRRVHARRAGGGRPRLA